MTKNYNATGEARKEMVQVISRELGVQAVYTRMPECAYMIDNMKVTKTGELVWDERTDEETVTRAIQALAAAGFTDQETETEETAEEPAEETGEDAAERHACPPHETHEDGNLPYHRQQRQQKDEHDVHQALCDHGTQRAADTHIVVLEQDAAPQHFAHTGHHQAAGIAQEYGSHARPAPHPFAHGLQ